MDRLVLLMEGLLCAVKFGFHLLKKGNHLNILSMLLSYSGYLNDSLLFRGINFTAV